MPGKKYNNISSLVEKREYDLDEAIELLPKLKTAKFDETVELAFHMGVDPKIADQNIRGMVSLPAGTGKNVRVLVFAKGEKEKEALDAGADYAGTTDLEEKIKSGWFDFDVAIATPDTMDIVGKLGRILGPRGLMPNPKLGTVTFDITKAVQEMKAGKIEYRVDKFSNIHVPVGKVSFKADDIKSNIGTIVETLIKAKPSTVKGSYIKKCHVSLTMSPSIALNVTRLIKR